MANCIMKRYNAAGREDYPVVGTSHFNPFSRMFKQGQRMFISD